MRVTTPELRVDSFDDRSQVESILLFRHPGYEHDEEQQVAQLVAEFLVVIGVHGLEDLVEFLYEMRANGGHGLRAVPRAPARRAERGRQVDEFLEGVTGLA